jgi:hypothetical protein
MGNKVAKPGAPNSSAVRLPSASNELVRPTAQTRPSLSTGVFVDPNPRLPIARGSTGNSRNMGPETPTYLKTGPLEPISYVKPANNLLKPGYFEHDTDPNLKGRTKETAVCNLANKQRMYDGIHRVISEMLGKNLTTVDYKDYTFSFYETAGIPKYSIITDNCFYHNIIKVFKLFNKKDANQRNILSELFKYEPGDEYKVNFVYHEDQNQPSNLFLKLNMHIDPIKDDRDNHYKIHFCVKEEYALYVFLKAMKLLKRYYENERGIFRQIVGKILLEFRYSQDYKGIQGTNHMAPTIVLYSMTSDPGDIKGVLEYLMKNFSLEEHMNMGALKLSGSSSYIPYGNIRISPILYFAQGDRVNKLETYVENRRSKTITNKSIPPWLSTMLQQASDNPSLVDKGKLFFGSDIDLSDPKHILHRKCTESPLCYFATNETMLDPSTLDGIDIFVEQAKHELPTDVPSIPLQTAAGRRKRHHKTRRSKKRRGPKM